MGWKRSSEHKKRMKKLSKVSSYTSGAYYVDEIWVKGVGYVKNPKPYYKRYYRANHRGSRKSAVDELKIADGRKKKPSLNCLNTWIKEDFFPEVNVDIKVNNIISYGYEGYHWKMDFDVSGETYSISIPNKKLINSENLSLAYEGKFAFMHRTGKSSISVEHTDYTEEDMAKFIKVYFDEIGR